MDLEDFVLVTLETVKLEFQVSEVPKGDSFVRRASGQDELGVGVETQAIDLEDEWFFLKLTLIAEQIGVD